MPSPAPANADIISNEDGHAISLSLRFISAIPPKLLWFLFSLPRQARLDQLVKLPTNYDKQCNTGMKAENDKCKFNDEVESEREEDT